MTIKKFKTEFTKYLANGGWEGPESGPFHKKEDNKPVGFFEQLQDVGLNAPIADKYFIEDDYSILKMVKFSNSKSYSSSGTRALGHTIEALKKSNFLPNYLAGLNNDKAYIRNLKTWFMPVLNDFINFSKKQDWYNPKTKDKFLTSILLSASAYTQTTASLYSTLDFLSTQNENGAFPNSVLFSYLSSVSLQRNFDSIKEICYYVENTPNKDFADYVRNNMHLHKNFFDESFGDKLSDKRRSSNYLFLNSLLKESYMNNTLSEETREFFKEHVIKDSNLEILYLKNEKTGETEALIPAIQFNMLKREKRNFFAPVYDSGVFISVSSVSSDLNWMRSLRKALPIFFSNNSTELVTSIFFNGTPEDKLNKAIDDDIKYAELKRFQEVYPDLKKYDYVYVKLSDGFDVDSFDFLLKKAVNSMLDILNDSKNTTFENELVKQLEIEERLHLKNMINENLGNIDLSNETEPDHNVKDSGLSFKL